MLDLITNHKEEIAIIVTGLVTICSGLANVVDPNSTFGKILHFIALNFKVGK